MAKAKRSNVTPGRAKKADLSHAPGHKKLAKIADKVATKKPIENDRDRIHKLESPQRRTDGRDN